LKTDLGVPFDLSEFVDLPPSSPSSPLRRGSLRDLKSETPLVSQDPSSSSQRVKTVSFAEDLQTLIPMPDSSASMFDARTHQDEDVDAFMTNTVAPMAQLVMDEAKGEQLDELDTILRVDVPQIEGSDQTLRTADQVIANSNPELLESHAVPFRQLDKEIAKADKRWAGLSKLERGMQWAPFPMHLGKISLDEEFDDGSCARCMSSLTLDDGPVEIETLLWKKEGLRVLDEHDSDDEKLEAFPFEEDVDDVDESDEDMLDEEQMRPPSMVENRPIVAAPAHLDRSTKTAKGLTDMQSLLKKRKAELEGVRKAEIKRIKGTKAAGERPDNITSHVHEPRAPAQTDAGAGGLSGFLGLQGEPMRPPGEIHVYPGKKPADPDAPAATTTVPSEEPQVKAILECLSAPTLRDCARRMSIVTSSNVLANRQLCRQIQMALPNLEMVERESALSSVPQNGQPSPSFEADFTLSASTGVLCTTLQKLKQKPLPGQTSFFGVHVRINSVCPRYEYLIVLVSEGSQDSTIPPRELDSRDTDALAELTGYTSTLDARIGVHYIAGGESELSQWIAACICRHAPVDGQTKLLQDETIWERLLRTGGANPCAAQVILAHLKRPEVIAGSESSSTYCGSNDGAAFGLAAFVQMSEVERSQRFASIMGGDRVMARVSALLDRSWASMGYVKG